MTGSGTQALVANMNAFLLALSTLSADASARVRKAVCQAIILLATVQLSILEPMFGSICTFMLKGVLDEDEGTTLLIFCTYSTTLLPFTYCAWFLRRLSFQHDIAYIFHLYLIVSISCSMCPIENPHKTHLTHHF